MGLGRFIFVYTIAFLVGLHLLIFYIGCCIKICRRPYTNVWERFLRLLLKQNINFPNCGLGVSSLVLEVRGSDKDFYTKTHSTTPNFVLLIVFPYFVVDTTDLF